uniref:Protein DETOXIFICATION n=1 Tax=Pyramimonas obovata TaxID=1411642 RepID=A0A7S0WNI1_9CHLO|mmetsp:Transcript_32149/g.70148  ORF Transcript_32149/g.70148 Transcript_32149/m.70148 type:complete len:592 (+) Transcript_32149:645-2420(+)
MQTTLSKVAHRSGHVRTHHGAPTASASLHFRKREIPSLGKLQGEHRVACRRVGRRRGRFALTNAAIAPGLEEGGEDPWKVEDREEEGGLHEAVSALEHPVQRPASQLVVLPVPSYPVQLDEEPSSQGDWQLDEKDSVEDDMEVAPPESTMGMVKEIAWVGVPEMLSCMVEPLLSLMETVIVGRMGTLFLAALGPGTSIFGVMAELCAVGTIATVSVVSRLTATAGGKKQIQNVMDTAVKGSLVGGVAMMIALNLAVWPMLQVLHCDELMVAAVHTYVTVRALGAPAFLISNFLEGCLVGMRDAVTPLKVYARSGVVTAVLMLLLATPVVGCQLGIAGCAVAIATGQVLCTFQFLQVLSRRGLLTVQWAAPLNLDLAKSLGESVGIMAIGTFARMGTYVTMTTVATSMGIVEGAVHKVAFESYYLLSFATEPMFTAATSLLPRDLKLSVARAGKLRNLLLLGSLVLGVLLAGVSLVATRTTLFSADPAVLSFLQTISPALAVMLLASSLVYSIEGILVGLGDIRYLTTIHCTNFVLMLAYSVAIKTFNLGMEGMWWGLAGYQCLRLVEHTVRFATTRPFVQNAIPDPEYVRP